MKGSNNREPQKKIKSKWKLPLFILLLIVVFWKVIVITFIWYGFGILALGSFFGAYFYYDNNGK